MTDRPRSFASRAGRFLVVAAFAFALTGCYAVEDSAERSVIRFSIASRLAIILVPACLLLGCAGLCYFRPTRILGALLFCGVAAISGIALPGMYLDTVVITPTEITQKTGFWFDPRTKGFRYADVRSVSIREEAEGAATMRVWTLRRKDGTTQAIDPGDLWNFNEAFVVQKLRGYGVTFE